MNSSNSKDNKDNNDNNKKQEENKKNDNSITINLTPSHLYIDENFNIHVSKSLHMDF